MSRDPQLTPQEAESVGRVLALLEAEATALAADEANSGIAARVWGQWADGTREHLGPYMPAAA
jgi:hypothetical protein